MKIQILSVLGLPSPRGGLFYFPLPRIFREKSCGLMAFLAPKNRETGLTMDLFWPARDYIRQGPGLLLVPALDFHDDGKSLTPTDRCLKMKREFPVKGGQEDVCCF